MRLIKLMLLILGSLTYASSCGMVRTGERVTLGDERFEEYVPGLKGKRVAVFSNHTGIVGNRLIDNKMGPHLVDVLIEKGIDVRVIFSPEHGFRGDADAGEGVASGKDEKTGVRIASLYGATRQPSQEDMDDFDVLLVDIQDVGLRYYTYHITMARLMESCARSDKKVIILDRPNPNGFYVDGPVLEMEYKSGVGAFPVPTVHGMTLGELALMINGEGWLKDGLKCDLEVVPCLGYTHQTKTDVIVPPSPNLKSMRAIYLYASTCYFEGTVVSLGRGTDFPFEIYGHPDIPETGFSFTPRSVPGAKNPPLKDQLCHGRDLRDIPLETIWNEGVNLEYVIDAFRGLGEKEGFFSGFFDKLAGTGYVREMILSGASAAEIKARWKKDVEAFKAKRRPYLIYPE